MELCRRSDDVVDLFDAVRKVWAMLVSRDIAVQRIFIVIIKYLCLYRHMYINLYIALAGL